MWEPASVRRDPVELLEEQARTRLPELVPIRYGRMLVSPFTFFRGAAYIMAADLANGTRTGLQTQLCGDAHLSNFGFFAAPDRRLVFSINDFDETLPGPFEWDVKRLVASFTVAARDLGFDEETRRSVVSTTARAYREAMASFAVMRHIDVWYTRLDADTIVQGFSVKMTTRAKRRMKADLAKARTKDSVRALAKLCGTVDGEFRIIGNPPLITPIEDVLPGAEQTHLDVVIRRMIDTYAESLPPDRRELLERYRYVHAARKVVGVGSVGTRAWILRLIGRDHGDPLFLQFKEALPSVLEPYAGKSRYRNQGERVVTGQRMLQSASDVFLGWTRDTDGRQYYFRQLRDMKMKIDLKKMSRPDWLEYVDICGWTLARAHARTGDAALIAGYLGKNDPFDSALAEFADAYADQTERDHQALLKAIRSGRVNAASPGDAPES
jgi:uncharacterized protein (DUF2252 family)